MNEADLQRNYRNDLLEIVDKINPIWWEEMSQEQKNVWRTYRQALLDITDQEGFPDNVEWPVNPTLQAILDAEVPPE